MSFTAQRIDHVEVFVRDLDESVRWYEDVLGLQVVHRFEPEPVMMAAGETKLALFRAAVDAAPGPEAPARSPIRWVRVAWRTDQTGFEAAQAHLEACDISFRGPVDHDIAQSIYFVDPDGNPLEITYYDDQSPR